MMLGLLDGVERWALDAQFAARGPVAPRTPVVVVSIDEDSFDELGLNWPFPRSLHAKLVDTISAGRPAAIGLDILFAEPSTAADDEALARAIARAGNVVLAAAFTAVEGDLASREALKPPLDTIRDHATGFGFVNFLTDRDAFVRSALLTRSFLDTEWPSFDLLLYRLGARAGIPAAPLPSSPEFLINFRGRPGTFPTVPFYRVVTGEVRPDAFAGKIVLVGATSPVLHDSYPAPFATFGGMAGVEIHANTLETLFLGIPIRRVPRALAVALVVAAALAAVWLADRLRPLRGLAAVLALGVAAAAAGFAAFVWGRLWVDHAPGPLALVLGYGAMVVENFIREQREKRRLSRFFSPAVVKEIVRHKDDVNLTSARRRITVLFSDIRGFTSMSEKMSPEDVVAFLREYLTVMSAAVFEHGGTVDKYIGDAIMALYNVPFDQPDHAEQAVLTALEFQERIGPLAARFAARYGGELRCGVGINTGDAVVGTIGAEQRLEYTAIGDTVNLGSRLESITKDFGVGVVISEATYKELRGSFATRFLGEVTVKGKEIPVKIYAVEGRPASRMV
jgi:adenylate cyclase